MLEKYLDFVAVDVETTGLREEDEIIEIGMVRVRQGEIVDTFQQLIKPSIPVPVDISIITGITQDMVKSAPSWHDIEAEVQNFIGNDLLLAHNYRFDKGHIESELGTELTNEWLDTHDVTKLFLPSLTSYKLIAIANHLHIDDSSHHRALNDAEVCAKVYLALINQAQQMDPIVLSDMASIFNSQQVSLFETESYGIGGLLKSLSENIATDNTALFFEDFAKETPTFLGNEPRLTFDEASSFFSENGLLSQHKKDFQFRHQQVSMLDTIKEAFVEKKHALIEAGTGTGKSFAYLIPSMLWSIQEGNRVVVATGTINLQEQLFQVDIPFLKKVLDYDFSTAIAKGRSNYLCLRRLDNYKKNTAQLSEREKIFLASLLLWQQENNSGDKEYLNLNKTETQYWNNISSTADTCVGKRCPYYQECYYFKNKRLCEQSDIIITNHSLLCQNLKIDGLLPEHRSVIVDEAHHLENEATRQFTDTIDCEAITKMVNNIIRTGGYLTRLHLTLGKLENLPENLEKITLLHGELQKNATETVDIVAKTVEAANQVPDLSNIGELRITDKIRNFQWWIDLEALLRKSQRYLATAITSFNKLLNQLEEIEELEALSREMIHERDKLAEQRDWLERFIAGTDNAFVYWASTYKNNWSSNLLLHAAYIDVMPLIKEKLFNKHDTVVLTSATLAVNKRLIYTAHKFLLEEEEFLSYITESPFDYQHQSLIAIPDNHPDYSKLSEFAYTKNVIDDLKKLIPAVDGDMLVLFTSYAMLNKTYMALKNDASLKEYTILAHGQDGSRSSILEALQNNNKTVVLGANSFWEGVDVKGAQLRTVVITKLPFVPPTMPIESAKSELLQAQGKNAFTYHSLPQAILRFRQGCGRLIRSHQDKGAIVILDNRVITKNYGSTFLHSLPEQPIWKNDIDTLTKELSEWHQS